MAAIAEAIADLVIVTDDNPRGEDGDAIVPDILAGFSTPAAVVDEHDRRAALDRAVGEAGADNIVQHAGEGHDTYQAVADVKHPPEHGLCRRTQRDRQAETHSPT